jgi:tRNA pseudouridine32 synthase/23S rRNA pseudouridine746 synthase
MGSKPAITHYQLLGSGKLGEGRPVSLVQCRLETGRTHQIRVHALTGLGAPLVGDPIYGTGKGAPRTMLHAAGLVIQREGKPPISAVAPMPDDFRALGFTDG